MLLLFFLGGGPYYIQLQKIIPQNFLTLNLVSLLFGGGGWVQIYIIIYPKTLF